MDFDIDAVLDQLEKTLNQSNHEENEIKSIDLPLVSPKKSTDDLLLLDLDPFGHPNIEQDNNPQDNLQSIQHDLEDLYPTPTIVLPEIATREDEDLSSVSLPLAVEQLEIEVREEILQHILEEPSASSLSPDLTTVSNDHEDEESEIPLTFTSIDEESTPTIETSNHFIDSKESDPIEHEITPATAVLHSVDSIVNLPTVTDHEIFIDPNPTLVDNELMQTSAELVFSPCNENDQEEEEMNQLISEDVIVDERIPSPPPSPTTITTAPEVTQDFDLVKHVLSEIFDKPDEENLDENPVEDKDSELIPIEQEEFLPPTTTTTVTNNNEDDFRFLDEMLASINVSDSDIHQLTPAEIDRVDSLLKDIVNTHQSEDIPTAEIESSLPVEEPPPPLLATASIESSSESATASGSLTMPVDEELIRVEQEWSKLTEEEKRLGTIAPEWVSDDLASACMKCAAKFSLTRRRHHCRACGKIFCSTCCWQKVKLIHEDSKEDRACNDCVRTINNVEYLWNYMRNHQKPRTSVLRKKAGTSTNEIGVNVTVRQGLEQKKSVTFDDGVKPGVETNAAAIAATNIMSTHKIRTSEINTDQISSFKPETLTSEECEERIRRLKDPNESPIELRIHNNLIVISKIVENFDRALTGLNERYWIFSTRGLCTVAQDELIFIFNENLPNPNEIISALLIHIHQIYLDATKGSFVRHFGISLTSSFLNSSNTAGFLYVSDLTSVNEFYPDAPYLFGILIDHLELPTAQCFPMRLLLRLGYEYQTYPWPLVNILNRNPMFIDTQQTIMSLLCDFRSFTYVLPTIRGLTISVGMQGSVSIRIPRNRHDDILKSLDQSSPHALSFGITNVNRQIHAQHLITIQNSTDQQYETRIFSSANATNEQIEIGANFLIVNASLRSRDSPSNSPLDGQNSGSFSSNSNLNAKVNALEDGIMLQIDGDVLKILKQCLRERKDYAILAKARTIIPEEQIDGNAIKRSSSEQLVEFLWTEEDNDVNRGIRSPIDHFPMDGIRNSRIHYAGQRSPLFRLRWTDLFFIECYLNNNESFDPTRLADSLAKAFIQALTPYVDMLVEAKFRKLGLRVTIDRENASYLAGSNGEQLPPFFLSQLDDHMISIVMKASDNVSRSSPSLVLELIFYLLD